MTCCLRWRYLMQLPVVCMLCLPLLGRSITVVLDDTGTYSTPAQPQMQWTAGRHAGGTVSMEALVRVHVRLDTRAYVRRQARIYLTLPPDGDAAVNTSWTSQDPLLGGQIAGLQQRSLLWSGVLTAPYLEGELVMHLQSKSRWWRQQRQLNFRFELDSD